MKTIYLATAFLCATSLCAPVARAQDSPTSESIETIVVQATRLDQQLYQVGSSIDVITAADLQQGGYQFLTDALAAAPGVTVNQNGAYGGSAAVRIRGASSEQTLVLIDGVVVNDSSSPGGGFDFSRLDPRTVERIEILKGPQSTLWGSDAIGGVVSIVTKSPAEKTGGSLFVEYGSAATLRGGVDFSTANAVGDMRVGVVSTETDGLSKADEDNGNSEDDAYASTTISAQGGINLPREARLNLSFLQTDADTDFDSFVAGAQGNVGDGPDSSETRERTAQLNLKVPMLDGRMTNSLSYGYADIERENFSNSIAGFSAVGERKIFRYQGGFKLNEGQQLGFGVEREALQSAGTDTTTNSQFLLYEWQPQDALTLTAGLRSDDIESYGRETTARLAMAYQLTEQLTLRGSWGQGFKAPTIFQTTFFCCGATAPNTGLAPEEADAVDVGVDWRSAGGDSRIGFTAFRQDIENLITFSFAAGGYENIAQARNKGVEMSLGHQFNDYLVVDLTYAYLHAEDEQGNPLIRVPEHTGDLKVSLSPRSDLNIAVVTRYNSKELESSGEVDSWIRLDLAAQYTLQDNLQLYMRVENLLDEDYQQILGYGTPGLSLSAGARWRF